MSNEPIHEPDILKDDEAYQEMMSLFNEKNYWQRMSAMFSGLKKPKDTKEYKIARIELQRQAAPALAIAIPVFLLGLLVIFGSRNKGNETVIEMQIEDPQEIEEPLDEIEPPEEQVFDDFQPTDVDFSPNVNMDVAAPAPDAPVSAQPQTYDTVLTIKSPVILRNIFGSTRNAGTRGQLLAGNGGNGRTEASVLRALRWLKQNQLPDGSWKNNKTAMTGLAVLTFLAHGEKPGDSPEFGETVQKALEFLVTTFNTGTGTWQNKDGNNYSHLIATYALCEAYGMTMNPNVRDVADQALDKIINGQNVHGGWDYNMKAGSDRNDLSYIGWAAQALHAADMANFYHDPEGLRRACKNAIKGIKHNGFPEGGFGYCGPQKGGLTSVGTLCLQFHGAANDSMVKNSLDNIIYNWAPEWVGATPENPEVKKASDVQKDPNVVSGACPQYYYYYGTQAVFQAGGDKWDKWNKRMWPSYVKAQLIKSKETSGYVDDKGNPQETGYWMNFDTHSDRPVMDTCLAALQMMVYYRYLPTFKKVDVPQEVVAETTDKGDIEVVSDL